MGQNRDLIAELDLKVQMQWVIRIMDGIIMDRYVGLRIVIEGYMSGYRYQGYCTLRYVA